MHMAYQEVIQRKGIMGGNHEALSEDVVSGEVQAWSLPWRVLQQIPHHRLETMEVAFHTSISSDHRSSLPQSV